MKCTQEQFESIKDRLPKTTFLITEFLEDCYLALLGDGSITNGRITNPKGYTIIETFNADIFLEACGVEVEKVEYQVWVCDEWKDTELIIRLKPQPNYSQEIEALQTKAKENGMKAVITFEKL